jgi:hypothetical protein
MTLSKIDYSRVKVTNGHPYKVTFQSYELMVLSLKTTAAADNGGPTRYY